MLLAIHLIVAASFLLLAIVFHRGKGASLIAGYNTMPKEERETIDEKKLCRYMRNLMLVLCGCWLVVAASEVFHRMWLLWLGLGLLLVSITIALVWMNTGGRIKR